MAKKKAVKTPSPAPTPTSTPKPTPTPTPTPEAKPTPTPTPPATPKAERAPVSTPTPAPTPTATPEPTPAFLSGWTNEDQELLKTLAEQVREVEARIAAAALKNLTSLIAWIKENVQHFGDDHKRQIRIALGEDTVERLTPAAKGKRGSPRGSKNTAPKAAKSGRGTNPIPKFRLPDGTEWNGKGRAPSSEFTAWSKSAAGKDWAKKNTTGFDWPLNPEWAKANPGKVKAEAKKAAKTVAKPAVKKAAKTPAKKASTTRAKKAAKKT